MMKNDFLKSSQFVFTNSELIVQLDSTGGNLPILGDLDSFERGEKRASDQKRWFTDADLVRLISTR